MIRVRDWGSLKQQDQVAPLEAVRKVYRGLITVRADIRDLGDGVFADTLLADRKCCTLLHLRIVTGMAS
jgi:hypothetical protein